MIHHCRSWYIIVFGHDYHDLSLLAMIYHGRQWFAMCCILNSLPIIFLHDRSLPIIAIHDIIFVAFLLQCQSWSIMVGNHWQNTLLLGSFIVSMKIIIPCTYVRDFMYIMLYIIVYNIVYSCAPNFRVLLDPGVPKFQRGRIQFSNWAKSYTWNLHLLPITKINEIMMLFPA